MKAVAYDRYGGPEVLRVVDLPEPQPGPGEVLLEVRATSVNLSDWESLTGSPAYARIAGLRRPIRPVLGSDVAGVVVAVGPGVVAFAPGDEVFGDNLRLKGGFARALRRPGTHAGPQARRPVVRRRLDDPAVRSHRPPGHGPRHGRLAGVRQRCRRGDRAPSPCSCSGRPGRT